MSTDEITKQWMRNASDELAVKNGCWFDVERGAFTVWWIERYCRLYEGEWAGEPVLLRAGNESELPWDLPVMEDWDEGGREKSIERAKIYAEWVAAGKRPDWQYECTMRLFGWAKHSERWGRTIRRFNQASIWIPKKQKKTPTLAAWGNYIICGDGEEGSKAFGGAKDGTQAQIAMDHAIAMIEQSPQLSAECKVNRNERSIFHKPTRSKYRPLSSANERSKTSKEGINGSILIDETHVVDKDFVRIIARAGISRAEPLRIDVSTAGNNPDGYGKERQDYARQVLAGAEQNDQLFVAIYEAPQDLKDEDLDKDPVKYGIIANPAWGHTAHRDEYLADYNEAKRTLAGLADFKMYRLNIWQHTANQWLRMDDWMRCGKAFELSDFTGERASVGLDLSKTRDMSALAVSIPSDGINYISAKVWVTEAYADAQQDKMDFREWGKTGALTIIPGDVIQHSYIRDAFDDLVGLLDLALLIYDRTYSAEFVQWLEESHKSILAVQYPQSSAFMEKPIDDFEAAVIEQELVHDNNPCLNWQAGHTSVAENHKGHRILKKPKHGDYRKIDGMVASVMALWGTTQMPQHKSVYKRRGVLCV